MEGLEAVWAHQIDTDLRSVERFERLNMGKDSSCRGLNLTLMKKHSCREETQKLLHHWAF